MSVDWLRRSNGHSAQNRVAEPSISADPGDGQSALARTSMCMRHSCRQSSARASMQRGLLGHVVAVVTLGLLALATWPIAATADEQRTADEIRTEATSSGVSGRPLPLAALWNAGWEPTGFTPSVQVQMVRDGHHILPTLYLPEPGAQNKGPEYYRAAIEVAKTLQLPLTFKSTQWESLLLADTQASIVARECGSTWAHRHGPQMSFPIRLRRFLAGGGCFVGRDPGPERASSRLPGSLLSSSFSRTMKRHVSRGLRLMPIRGTSSCTV